MEKEMLRQQLRTIRRHLPAREKQKANKQIAATILALPEIHHAKSVCVYISLPEEVDTRRIIESLWKQGKAIVVPKIVENFPMLMPVDSWTDLRPGQFGILEPVGSQFISAQEVDVCLVPGIAFDKNGNRLGWGKGYYDRLLAKVNTPKIGLAYDFQVVAQVPHTSYDVPVTHIITQKEMYAIKKD